MDLLAPTALRIVDPEIFDAIENEDRRQHINLELIASENYASAAVREASGSIMTNKYAEGYPGRRYYGGCEFVDVAETLAIDRAKQLFAAQHANVQAHAGAQANMAVFMAVLQPGDTVLGMSLAHGGHLTHGTKMSFSGKIYHAVAYGVRNDSEVDRLRRSSSARARTQAEVVDRRRECLSADDGLRPVSRDRGRTRRTLHGRHGAHRRTRRDGSASLTRSARRVRDHDDA